MFVFFVELAIPFLIFAPRLWRFVGGGFLILLQLLIALTGNYAFFNLLTVALCVLLFDDAFLERFFPRALAERLRVATPNPRRFSLRRWVTAPVALIIFAAGLLQLADLLSIQWVPPSAFQLLSDLEPVRIVNGYGLFAVMTTSRPEIIIEGSNDGEDLARLRIQIQGRGPAPRPALGGALSAAPGLANVVRGAGGLSQFALVQPPHASAAGGFAPRPGLAGAEPLSAVAAEISSRVDL